MTPEALAAHYDRMFDRHELHVVHESDEVQVYRLLRPGTRMMSVNITFAFHYIHISGDFSFNGVSVFGYGRGWFSEVKSRSYLREKFHGCFRKRWDEDEARAELVERMKTAHADGLDLSSFKVLREAYEGLDWNIRTVEALVEKLQEYDVDAWESPPGYGYDPREIEQLAAVNRCFARLWAARNAEVAA